MSIVNIKNKVIADVVLASTYSMVICIIRSSNFPFLRILKFLSIRIKLLLLNQSLGLLFVDGLNVILMVPLEEHQVMWLVEVSWGIIGAVFHGILVALQLSLQSSWQQ